MSVKLQEEKPGRSKGFTFPYPVIRQATGKIPTAEHDMTNSPLSVVPYDWEILSNGEGGEVLPGLPSIHFLLSPDTYLIMSNLRVSTYVPA
jgi:hypothetical protein